MLLLRHVHTPIKFLLNQLALDHLARHFRQDVKDLEVPLSQGKMKRGHVEPVPHQDGDLVPPLRIHGGAAPPYFRVIDDIVVNQGGGMNHFHYGPQPIDDRSLITAHLRGKQKQGRPDALSAAVLYVPGDAVDELNVRVRVPLQLAFDFRESFLDQFEDFLRIQIALSKTMSIKRVLTRGSPRSGILSQVTVFEPQKAT